LGWTTPRRKYLPEFAGVKCWSRSTLGRAPTRCVRPPSRNQIGEVGAPRAPEVSGDFTFIADGRDKFGLGFLITADQHTGKRSPGSLSWVRINSAYFWVDPAQGVAGVVLMQYRPFADARALAVYDAFERAVYRQLLR
jgi:CubicO group peptidase (beta-lactamase class C family)